MNDTTPNGTAIVGGQAIWQWCSSCMDRTHFYYYENARRKLVCENDTQHSEDKRDE